MSAIDELKSRANIIKQEEEEGKNTALRVGGLLYDVIDYIDGIGGGTPTPSEKTSVIVTPVFSGGTQVANIAVDGITQSIWAPSPTTPTPGYDDTAISRRIDNLDSITARLDTIVAQERTRLDALVQEIDTEVKSDVEDLINDAKWIQTMFPEHKVTWQAGWDENIEAYISTVGFWENHGVVTDTQWSQIEQKVNSVTISANEVISAANGAVNTLSSQIQASVEDAERAVLNLKTEYARTDEIGTVIEWLYSALKSETSPTRTYNEIVSAASDGSIGDAAVASIRTCVTKVDGGTYVAEADMVTEVGNSIAGLYEKADPSSAEINLFTQVKKDANQINTWQTSPTAGVVLKTDLNSATASLVAIKDYNAATITAMVNDAGSEISLNADKITFTTEDIEALGARMEVGSLKAYNQKDHLYVSVNSDGINCAAEGSTDQSFTMSVAGQGSLGYKTIKWEGSGGGNVTIGKNSTASINLNGTTTIEKLEAHATNTTTKLWGNGLDIRQDNASHAYHELPAGPSFRLGNGAITFSETADNKIYINKDLKVKGVIQSDETLHLLGNTEVAIGNRLGEDVITIATRSDDTNRCYIEAERIYLGDLYTSKICLGDENQLGTSVIVSADEFYGNTPYIDNSDERLKDIHAVLSPDINAIANTRIVDYTLKKQENKIHRLGAIAQDWMNIFPDAVVKNKDGYYGLDYASTALASAVTAAREVVALKEENKLLRERLEKLEKLILSE